MKTIDEINNLFVYSNYAYTALYTMKLFLK